MKSKELDKTRTQMKRGVLEMCVLSLIKEQKTYGREINERLKDSNLVVVEGTLYPLLSRLKKAELLEYELIESEYGPARKYYNLTPKGEEFLGDLLKTWGSLVDAVTKMTQTAS
ncbi:MAG: PadR family transcriptional regulator [Bacteroidetes bacterium]|nr:MAG: PadR family transcriptional regulator [Bacteroidota bacterium]